MTLETCSAMLQEHDPDRFGAVLAAAPQSRDKLLTLYALNLELARAPFQSNEPMLARMRLQWWIDRLAEMGQGTAPPSHDVLGPLWQVWGEAAGSLVPLAEARERDCAREPFARPGEVLDYVNATAGGLMWAAAKALGASDASRDAVLAQGRGQGLAAWLGALPQLQSLGLGLLDDQPQQVAALAQAGVDALAAARAARRTVPRSAAAALFAGPGAAGVLGQLVANGGDIGAEIAAVSPFRQRAALARLALTGRWWVWGIPASTGACL
ncbi:squalene/phytoene synthase family protein [Paracoccus tegillarcae]|uniref:Phytoene synthase n=1 Tax=Paracoccus tegillarcae TaxID=1529068 RepID=A0A2K9F3B4_9RHOB|nr:squalene/phytoene synthase family protein [Paracoccus tegillarcae]AUH34862.1 hypothetical protein CUV01_17065 [Paracoccus tegillarcae]